MPGGRSLFRAGLALVPVAVLAAILGIPGVRNPGTPTAEAAQPGNPGPLPPFKLEKGDHICIIGNTLAERMQHDGWVESFLYARHPEHNLVIRNLGYSADELTTRLRSQDFGTPDQWLSGKAPIPKPEQVADKSVVLQNRFEKTNTNADVIFAFFGYNESWQGEEGLPKFKKDLENFIKHTLAQKYNGKSAPRLVLFSPIAFEDHKSPNLPTGADAEQINKNLELYTKAMGEVAGANGVHFVDLLTPTKFHFSALALKKMPKLTINGVHLTEDGNRVLAGAIDAGLFPVAGKYAPPDEKLLAKIRPAVQDKAFHWFQRYRVTDGYSTYGGRAWLKFTGGQTNYEVVQKELEVLDVMTANRDKVIWEVAKGKEAKPDDSNLPKFVPVKTNKPGAGPDGTHLFLSGEEAIEKMTVGKGLKVTLFADEKMFPELAKPVQMAWDTKGRLWVAVWPSYPHWKPTEPYNDKLLIFEDTNGDGKADKVKEFAGGLQNPTGFEFYNGGVIVAQAPDLMFLKDTTGDDKADVRQRILHGLDTADTHHTSNSFVLDPGGALYFQEGTFHHTQTEDPYGPPARLANGGVFRYEPRTQKFDVYVAYNFANPHGHVFDKWGQDIVIDGTGAQPFHAPLFSTYLPGDNVGTNKHGRPPQVYQQRTRPSGGMEIMSSKHFPPEWEGNLAVTNCIGFQGILRYKISDLGGSLTGQEQEPILSSSDPNFRPVDCKMGPDGALYFIDWQNPIIGHMQHNLRDPNRDRTKGRIYKVSYEGRQFSESPKIAGESIEKLLDLLQHPEDRVRYRAKIELGARDSQEVVAAAKKWANRPWGGADPTHHILEALWVHQYHNVVDTDLLKQLLMSKDFRARAAAVRVLTYWRDRVPDSLDLLKKAAADDHPRVRLMAVWGASYFPVPEAAEVVFIAQDKPADQFVDHVAKETMRTLGPLVKKAIAEKKPIKFTTAAGARYFLKSVATDDLLKMDRSPAVYLELLFRPGVRDEFRREALTGLAKQDKKPELDVLVNAIRTHDESAATEESVAFDLARLLTAMPMPELMKGRAELEALATKGRSATTRQIGFVSLVAADGGVEKAWALATKSVDALQDFVAAMPMVRDPGARAALYPKVKALLDGLPPELAKTVGAGKSVKGRYVRIELPGKQRTLTLAEVQVFSDGINVATKGEARQSSTEHGGVASRAIDGNTSGIYADGTSTHTSEGSLDPWWEVDLGREVPIEQIVVWNRTDGALGNRINNFGLRVLDADKRTVFQALKNRTPKEKAEFKVGAPAPERVIRKAAMLALASVRGEEADAFKAVAKFLPTDDRSAAVQALLRIPPRLWPKDDAKATLEAVMKFIRSLPVAERTSATALDFMQLGEGLAGLLPPDEARAARKELSEIGVRVIRVGTLFDQMSYDKERMAVQAGKPVEFVFENTDIMPHNFVIVTPGNLEKIGNAAEAFATTPGAAAAQYVPPMPAGVILLKSKLLQTRESQQLKFTAPKEPGIYPYVCTYPGHWRRMHGALYVVADLEAYQANPEDYLAKNPLPVKDDLLKYNRPRTEWKLVELADSVKEMEMKGGRNFANGKQMFTVATCVACHKFGGQGNEFGPDLAKLDPKVFKSATDVVDHILDPAKRIDDKYAMYRIVTVDMKVLTAMIVEEKDGVVKLIENPLASAKPIELKRADIDEQKKAPTSIMPKGQLDKLTRDEILDLLAYVWGRADPKSKLFGDHGHDH